MNYHPGWVGGGNVGTTHFRFDPPASPGLFFMNRAQVVKYFKDNYYFLDPNDVLDLSKKDTSGSVNNVIIGIAEYSFITYQTESQSNNQEYTHTYITYKDGKLDGLVILCRFDSKIRNHILAAYAGYISTHYEKHPDPKTVFNTFQYQFRTMAEQLGYFTYSDSDLEAIPKGLSVSVIIPGFHKGILFTPFERKEAIVKRGKSKVEAPFFVYIMINKRNGYYKIGRSNNPEFREKTLQAEDPDVILVHKWYAKQEYESILHSKYKHKRKRGEWFDLTEEDVVEINIFMCSTIKP